jgi:hypothetical protein
VTAGGVVASETGFGTHAAQGEAVA